MRIPNVLGGTNLLGVVPRRGSMDDLIGIWQNAIAVGEPFEESYSA